MKLGLIGLGKQGQRYLMEKNGGRHIVRSGSREIDYEGLDGVIIATHPAGHKKLALECIERGLPVLVEKPLALTLADCDEILDAALQKEVPLEVAHTHLWSRYWCPSRGDDAFCMIEHASHERDYSAYVDWAPHGLALLADALPHASRQRLSASVAVHPGTGVGVCVYGNGWSYLNPVQHVPPMFLMVRDFIIKNLEHAHYTNPGYWFKRNEFNRRVYHALYPEQHDSEQVPAGQLLTHLSKRIHGQGK